MSEKGEYVFLRQVSSRIEADIVMTLLASEGVACFDEENPLGGCNEILMGSSVYGNDIYVAKDDFEKAEEILAGAALNENE